MSQDVLVLDRNWVPNDWISLQEAMINEANDKVLDHLGESLFMYRGGINKSGTQSTLETSSIIIVDGTASNKRYRDPSLTNSSLFQRDRYMCAFCGGIFRNSELTRDHYHPTSKGGKDVWMNVVSACKECNALKGDILPGAKLPKDSCGRQILGPQGTGLMEPLFVPYVPCAAEHMIMKNKHIKFDQMQFLLGRVNNKKSRIFEYAVDLFPQLAA